MCRVYSSCYAVMLGKRMPVTLLPTLFYERNLEWRFMCLQSVSFCPCKLSRSNMKLWEKNMQSKGGNLMVKAVQFPPVRRDAMSRRLNADLMFWSAVMFHLSGGVEAPADFEVICQVYSGLSAFPFDSSLICKTFFFLVSLGI